MRTNGAAAIYHKDGSALLLSLKTGNPIYLSPTAGELWRLIEKGRAIEESIQQIAAQHKVPIAELTANFEPVLETLKAQGVLQRGAQ